MSSLMTMQAAVASVNCGLKAKPSALKNAIDLSRSLTGRLTKILVGMVGRSPLGCSGDFAAAAIGRRLGLPLVFVVKPHPAHDARLVAALRRQVEPIEGAGEELGAARIDRVGVEDLAAAVPREHARAVE